MTDRTPLQILLSDYAPAPDLLHGKNILITGAGDGIGRALALACARHGATVILLGRTVKKLEAVYDEIETAGYAQAAIFPLDLEKTAAADFEQLGTALGEHFPCLDALVHCAASLGQHTPLVLADPEMWQRVLQVNLTAPFLITRACYPLLSSAAQASVIFTSDAVATQGRAYWGAYAASKAGLVNLMQILADEWENNTSIRVNALDPGPVSTRLRRQAFPGEDPHTVPAPEACLPAFLYLLDPHTNIRGKHLHWQGQSLSLSGN